MCMIVSVPAVRLARLPDLAAAAASDVVNCSVSRARSTFDLALSCYAKARYAYYDASTESRSLAKYHFLLDIYYRIYNVSPLLNM